MGLNVEEATESDAHRADPASTESGALSGLDLRRSVATSAILVGLGS